jgi:hypothetical protein
MLAVKLTVQELLLVLVAVKAQGFGVTLLLEPVGPPLIVKLTVPTGALFVPLAVSVTVTVHIAGLLAGVDDGQSSVVDVVRRMTSTVSLPLLPAWIDPAIGL